MATETLRQCTVTPEQLAVMHPVYDAKYWRRLLQQGKIPGAAKIWGRWFVPINAVQTLMEGGHERA